MRKPVIGIITRTFEEGETIYDFRGFSNDSFISGIR